MTELRPGGQPRPFTPAELDGATGVSPDDMAAGTRVARDLEALAARTPVTSSSAFADGVMSAIAAEPAAAPARLAGRALRHGAIGAFLLSLRDAWRVTTSVGFPLAARAQALALVLVVAMFVTGSGMVTAGALGLLSADRPTPAPSFEAPSPPDETSTSEASTPESSSEPSVSPGASESTGPSESPDSSESAEPSGSAEPDISSVDNGGSSGDTIQPTPRPTPAATSTPHDGEHSGSPSGTPQPSETPHSTQPPD
jgi:hypothetical protein